MATDNNATRERAEIDPVFKEVMTFSFGELSIPIETQVEVSRLPRTMDALVVLLQAEEREKVRASTAFDYALLYNQLECKGKEDRLTLHDYHLIRGRTHLYLGEKKSSASEMTVTIISARKPRKVLYHSPEADSPRAHTSGMRSGTISWEKVGAGHYVSGDLPPVHLFVCNELELVPENYPLLLFAASKKKFRRFVEQIVSEDNTIYIHYASCVEPEITKEVLKLAGKLSLYEKQLQRIAESMGEDLIPFLGGDEKQLQRIASSMGEEVVDRVSPEKRVRGLTLSERLGGLTDEELRSLSPEAREVLLRLMNNQNENPN